MIVIVAALERELRPLRQVPLPETATLATGIGGEAVKTRLPAFLAHHQPGLLISTGFAGALRAGLSPGEIVLAERLLTEDDQEIKIDEELLYRSGQALDSIAVHRGKLLTWSRPIRTSQEKERLGRSFGAVAVEMEAFPSAELAHALGIPFLAVKAILDPMEQTLPPFVLSLRGGGGFSKEVLVALVRNLGQIGALPWLVREAGRAGRSLAAALQALTADFPGKLLEVPG
jgi:adenosylhomocysteine nucleosidase